MTLAHELRHLVQYCNERDVWAFNNLVARLPKPTIQRLELKWRDVPVERDARAASKRVCESLLGREVTASYIDERIQNGTLSRDIEDWLFMKSVDQAQEEGYRLRPETGRLFQRLTDVRVELERALQDLRGCPEFANLNLDDAFNMT